MNDQDTEKESSEVRWLFVLTAVLLTRLSWAPSFLSTDTVNLAYALESFDPRQHQPQPPGYPLFVAFAKLVRWFTPSTEIAFWFISVMVTIASAAVLYLLAKRMISSWAGIAAVILFVLNPVFWFSRLHSPLRPWLALFSLLVAYCAWRAWNGERRFAWYGAVVLGVGSGFRPDLLPYLFPVWVASVWMATRSYKAILHGGLVIAGVSAVWFVAVVDAMGGISSTMHTMSAYMQEQSRRDSLVFAESVRLWLRPVSRLITWNALALAGWIWVPVVGYRRLAPKTIPWKFLLAWAVPGLAFQVFFHIAAPGHTLFATPVLCLLGASLMAMMGRYRNATLAVAAIVNVALFANALPLGYPAPAGSPPLERAWISVRNSIAFGTFETSQDRLRWWEEITEVSMKELREFTPVDRPAVVIALNGTDTEFEFVNWRVVSYYMDQQPLWILSDHLPAGQFGRVRRAIGRNVQLEPGSTISLPRGGRVLWIMMPDGSFNRALKRVIPLHRGRYISYSDIRDDLEAFEIDGFHFQPELSFGDGRAHTRSR